MSLLTSKLLYCVQVWQIVPRGHIHPPCFHSVQEILDDLNSIRCADSILSGNFNPWEYSALWGGESSSAIIVTILCLFPFFTFLFFFCWNCEGAPPSHLGVPVRHQEKCWPKGDKPVSLIHQYWGALSRMPSFPLLPICLKFRVSSTQYPSALW